MDKTTTQPTPDRIMQFGLGWAPLLILHAATENRVFDVLDGRPLNVEQVASATSVSIKGLQRVMDALVSFELLEKDQDQRYSLTPESSVFLVSSKPSFHGGWLRHLATQMFPNWQAINQVVRTGRPVICANDESVGGPFFREFVESLFPTSYPAAQVLADHLKISEAQEGVSVLDLAAGSGVWGITLAQRSPHVRVCAVDWQGVIPVTQNMARRFGVDDRFEFVKDDLLAADFGRGHDIAILGHILHSEGADRGRILLKKTFEALRPGGTVAIAEWLANKERTGPANAIIFAFMMLLSTDNGDTFSFEEISEWLLGSGYHSPYCLEAPGPSPLILATKPRI
jgi:2-polyprenyl-3-methyl-5-hydroxy-6-metoxy-1,4-benzoquinol methylase